MIQIKRAESIEQFDWILKDPEIFPRIAEDGIEPEEFNIPSPVDNCYLLAYDDDLLTVNDEKPSILGVWCLYPVNKSTLNIHANMIKHHRMHAKKVFRLILDWFLDDCPKQYVKLNAEIPEIYQDVYHFTKSVGFTDEGINRLSIKKNGDLVNQYRLGLTREEAQNICRS